MMRHLVPVDHADGEMGNPGKPAWNYKLLLRVLVRRRGFSSSEPCLPPQSQFGRCWEGLGRMGLSEWGI